MLLTKLFSSKGEADVGPFSAEELVLKNCLYPFTSSDILLIRLLQLPFTVCPGVSVKKDSNYRGGKKVSP